MGAEESRLVDDGGRNEGFVCVSLSNYDKARIINGEPHVVNAIHAVAK